jgi:hypothetical protein
MPRLYGKSALFALFFTRQNELTPNQMNETVKHTASTSRPGPAAWPDWYFPYSRMPASAPIPPIAKKVNPVTSNQSWCNTRPKERAMARVPASTARPLRLRCTLLATMLAATRKINFIFLAVWPSIFGRSILGWSIFGPSIRRSIISRF